MPYIPSDYEGMQENDRQARLTGELHGYDAANYAVNVSGEPVSELHPEQAIRAELTDTEHMWFADGFSNGIEQYEREQLEAE